MSSDETARHPHEVERVRLDQWLWAARLFRSRSLAKQAIESGRVRYQGERPKASRNVEVGARVTLRQGWAELELVVRALADTRLGAPLAQLLYQETPESRTRREHQALERRAAAPAFSPHRPTKKERRQIHRFKRALGDGDGGEV